MERVKRALIRNGESAERAEESVKMILDDAEEIVMNSGNFDDIGEMLLTDYGLDADYEQYVLMAIGSRF